MSPLFSPTKILDALILMQIVLKGPQHGYALAALIEEKFNWRPSQTAIYNSLKSMEKAGLVSSEERIESGRVQKIYSITEEGRHVFNEHQEAIRNRILKNFSQFLSFIQMAGEVGNLEESRALQLQIQAILRDMARISRLTFLLLHKKPEKTGMIIQKTLESLEKLAKENNVQFQFNDCCTDD
ncbi:MAG: hypothetical protein DRP02_06680 [Candidatus Gerdarchaeota archaeon]|nr:MAG: hypothetical protein DRP02_06680 [Candidatus Gerdarchaeota archaeon]